MSIVDERRPAAAGEGKRRLAAAGFIALLALSVFWPSPIVSVNRLCCNADIGVDELSFLGREAAAWDVAFWFLAGLFALSLIDLSADYREPWRILRALRIRLRAIDALALVAAAAVVALAWLFADGPVIAWAERVQSDAVEDFIRIANRFGGGMNPAMVVGFFLLAGVAFRHRRWIGYAAAMTIAGLAAGILGQLVKLIVGRSRPELWLGPFHHARAAASSFPSGHTVGAFALAGVLVFASPSRAVRAIAVVLAAAVGLSRILAFRHWPSDVLASAAAGLLVAWIVTRGVSQLTNEPRRAA
jgi:membrane-associated phospholipid phosphatase